MLSICRPFYGYHEKEHLFFKIYFYNPAIVKRTADLLQASNSTFFPFIEDIIETCESFGKKISSNKYLSFSEWCYSQSKFATVRGTHSLYFAIYDRL